MSSHKMANAKVDIIMHITLPIWVFSPSWFDPRNIINLSTLLTGIFESLQIWSKKFNESEPLVDCDNWIPPGLILQSKAQTNRTSYIRLKTKIEGQNVKSYAYYYWKGCPFLKKGSFVMIWPPLTKDLFLFFFKGKARFADQSVRCWTIEHKWNLMISRVKTP